MYLWVREVVATDATIVVLGGGVHVVLQEVRLKLGLVGEPEAAALAGELVRNHAVLLQRFARLLRIVVSVTEYNVTLN